MQAKPHHCCAHSERVSLIGNTKSSSSISAAEPRLQPGCQQLAPFSEKTTVQRTAKPESVDYSAPNSHCLVTEVGSGQGCSAANPLLPGTSLGRDPPNPAAGAVPVPECPTSSRQRVAPAEPRLSPVGRAAFT